MINTIASVRPGVQGPSGRQIGGIFLQEEVEDITTYLNTLKQKWPKYGCTIMCDGWSTRNKHPIINFMIYCDRNMIFHSSVDCTNKRKTSDFILSLLNKFIDDVGEENVVHVVTYSESANKAAGQKLMIERPHLFWSPCAAHSQDLKRLCTSVSKRRKDAEKIASLILDSRFWKTAREICAAMEPLVKVLKLVDEDNKPTLSIIYEAMDRAKMSIKESVKDWQLYWDVIDDRWYNQLHQHLHAAGKTRLYFM
ncbi:hypothetical protein F511_41897 [Dorcoceras hygrometricum]|uniref:DUF659 domain-containing protein n=1 Tax=Dorcoceras hygrometricum TaxID=472368 RepID=A0A2Z7A4Z8_9LAMI|nr:hypothetical protein F511_41897 [Dorcoceras hygrometricum]